MTNNNHINLNFEEEYSQFFNIIKKAENYANYRPISLTKCFGKLTERIVKIRLVAFLDRYNYISDYQSGFRKRRQTTDNLFFLCQKTLESFDENSYTCGVVFDIHKAFDKVWQDGLIYKLAKLELPKKLGNLIVDFIKKDNSALK